LDLYVNPFIYFCSIRLNYDNATEDSSFENISQWELPVKRESDDCDVKQDDTRRGIGKSSTTSEYETVSPENDIITAVERLSTNADLVADGSRCDALPTISGKHKDLKAISPQTVSVTI